MTGKYRVLSGSALKLIAMLTMLIDHVAVVLLLKYEPAIRPIVKNYGLSLYSIMRNIGRISFPIFAFLLVEGFIHTGNRFKYGRNLLVFALISELPWNLLNSGSLFYGRQNVFFTLLFGYAGLCALEYFENDTKKRVVCLLMLLAASILFGADYGVRGFGFIIMLYMLRDNRVVQAVVGSCVLPSTWIAGLAFIPINLYNGRRGFIRGSVLKYMFYVSYPLHMLILYFIKSHFIGY